MRTQDFTKNAPGHLESIPEGVGFVPDPLPPPRAAFDDSACCGLSEEAAVSLGGLRMLIEVLPNARLLIDSFLRREAVRSSKIEGTKTELGKLLLFEVGEKDEDDLDPADAQQVQRNLEAFNFGLQLVDDTPLNGRALCQIHDVLFEGASKISKRPGEYRISSTRIGGRTLDTVKQSFEDARFVPTPSRHIQQAMKDWENFINVPELHSHLTVLVQLALAHYQFETIHPFADGNGRIGRLAISLMLKTRGLLPQPILCLSAYMDDHRDEYIDGMLSVSQRGEWVPWVRFFLRAVRDQASEDTERCRRLVALRDEQLNLCQKKNVPLPFVDALFSFPATTITRVAKSFDVTFPTGRRYVEALENVGMLVEVTGRQKNRVYLAQPIIDLLEKPLL